MPWLAGAGEAAGGEAAGAGAGTSVAASYGARGLAGPGFDVAQTPYPIPAGATPPFSPGPVMPPVPAPPGNPMLNDIWNSYQTAKPYINTASDVYKMIGPNGSLGPKGNPLDALNQGTDAWNSLPSSMRDQIMKLIKGY